MLKTGTDLARLILLDHEHFQQKWDRNMKLLSVRTVLTPDITQIGWFEAKSGQQYSVYFRSADIKVAPDRTDHFFIIGLIAAFLRGCLAPVEERRLLLRFVARLDLSSPAACSARGRSGARARR